MAVICLQWRPDTSAPPWSPPHVPAEAQEHSAGARPASASAGRRCSRRGGSKRGHKLRRGGAAVRVGRAPDAGASRCDQLPTSAGEEGEVSTAAAGAPALEEARRVWSIKPPHPPPSPPQSCGGSRALLLVRGPHHGYQAEATRATGLLGGTTCTCTCAICDPGESLGNGLSSQLWYA